jgi:hypothetical protein
MTTPTKSAARKTAPARKSPKPANDMMVRAALSSAKSPDEQTAILAVITRSSEIMAKTIAVMAETNQIMAKLGHLATLKRGLISLSKSMGKI